MQRHIIHITTVDEPLPIQVRRAGVVNFGLYCRCGEFIAFSVSEPRQPPLNVEFAAEHPVLVRCPFCQQEERRQVHQIMRLPLTEANRRETIEAFERPQRHRRGHKSCPTIVRTSSMTLAMSLLWSQSNLSLRTRRWIPPAVGWSEQGFRAWKSGILDSASALFIESEQGHVA
jgi:hypothetical protein